MLNYMKKNIKGASVLSFFALTLAANIVYADAYTVVGQTYSAIPKSTPAPPALVAAPRDEDKEKPMEKPQEKPQMAEKDYTLQRAARN